MTQHKKAVVKRRNRKSFFWRFFSHHTWTLKFSGRSRGFGVPGFLRVHLGGEWEKFSVLVRVDDGKTRDWKSIPVFQNPIAFIIHRPELDFLCRLPTMPSTIRPESRSSNYCWRVSPRPCTTPPVNRFPDRSFIISHIFVSEFDSFLLLWQCLMDWSVRIDGWSISRPPTTNKFSPSSLPCSTWPLLTIPWATACRITTCFSLIRRNLWRRFVCRCWLSVWTTFGVGTATRRRNKKPRYKAKSLLISRLIDWLIAWLVISIQINRKLWIDWLIEWLGNSTLIVRLIDWLIDWLMHHSRPCWHGLRTCMSTIFQQCFQLVHLTYRVQCWKICSSITYRGSTGRKISRLWRRVSPGFWTIHCNTVTCRVRRKKFSSTRSCSFFSGNAANIIRYSWGQNTWLL